MSDRYHRECLHELTPVLNDVEVLMDKTILAAMVILRCLEELESMSNSS